MNFKKFVLEIGTEEMPYWAVEDGVSQLKQLLAETFEKEGIEFSNLYATGGPRRLVVLAEISEKQKDRVEKVRGPAAKAAFDENGNPTPAAVGFARSQGLQVSELTVEEINGGKYVVAVKKIEGISAKEFLKIKLPEIIQKLSFKKSMRWGSLSFRFVRPIRWILALFSNEVIEFEIAGVKSGKTTRGHRFLGERELEIDDAGSYEYLLEERGKVVVDHERRRAQIVELARKAAEKVGGTPIINEEVLKEVVQLVEYPGAVVGEFGRDYLELPEEVLITVMQHHQRYFPVRGSDGRLLNYFVVIHNGSPEFEHIIKEGNERVVKARFDDARFFFSDDLKKPLESLVEGLKGVVFQKKLGSLYDKTLRNIELARYIAELLEFSETEKKHTERAAKLLKADLLTDMVNEFDELQGIMGKEYALRQGEPEEVAAAIYEHYLPVYYGDELPQTNPGRAAALADKIDTVTGYFLAGLEPTGSEDPYSLRRQAQGVCLILLSLDKNLSLLKTLKKSLELYSEIPDLLPHDYALERLIEFYKARFLRILKDRGFENNFSAAVIDEVFERQVTAIEKLKALKDFSEKNREKFENLLTAYQRVRNLSKPELGTEYDTAYLEEPEEKKLADAVEKASQQMKLATFLEQLEILSSLKQPVDEFFDNVLVMHEDELVRENRLKLLNRTLNLYHSYASFSSLI